MSDHRETPSFSKRVAEAQTGLEFSYLAIILGHGCASNFAILSVGVRPIMMNNASYDTKYLLNT